MHRFPWLGKPIGPKKRKEWKQKPWSISITWAVGLLEFIWCRRKWFQFLSGSDSDMLAICWGFRCTNFFVAECQFLKRSRWCDSIKKWKLKNKVRFLFFALSKVFHLLGSWSDFRNRDSTSLIKGAPPFYDPKISIFATRKIIRRSTTIEALKWTTG